MVAMRDQQTNLSSQLMEAMRQGMMTPVSPLTPDPEQQKSQVLQMLRQGQLNAAFQQVSDIGPKSTEHSLSVGNLH